MLAKVCQYVILGHSERRTGRVAFSEQDIVASATSDAAVNCKVHAALAHGLTPIICVGENLEQNEAGLTEEWVSGQVRAALDGLTAKQVQQLVIAYEPIWAIGTGKPATSAGANSIIGLVVRGTVADLFGEQPAQAMRIQYGGSVKPANIAEFMTQPEIDGALVGGASLKADDFVALTRIAAETKGTPQ